MLNETLCWTWKTKKYLLFYLENAVLFQLIYFGCLTEKKKNKQSINVKCTPLNKNNVTKIVDSVTQIKIPLDKESV